MADGGIGPEFEPQNKADMLRCLADPMWRLCSGKLYKIMVKSAGDDGETVVPFKPNRAQRRLIRRLWHRNIILKARQLGFTTLIAIMWLDHALFNADQRCGIIAQDLESAKKIFRDKVKLAYDRLPEELRQAMPLAKNSADELLFAHNNSSVQVAVSLRGGTLHRLHVSEFGKIGARFPEKAAEVVTGSLPAVPLDGIAVIESTAEGQDGEFYKMTQRAMALFDAGHDEKLTPRDFRFHFYPWWEEPGYRLDDPGVLRISVKDEEYFAEVESKIGRPLEPAQRWWYIATRESDFSGDAEKMWQEYPSTPAEAFQVSSEGKYYAVQIVAARKSGRIGHFPYVEGVPVNTFWDIGKGDGTGVWLHQYIALQNRFFKYIEGWGEPYSHYFKQLQELKCLWGKHYVPHDVEHGRQQLDRIWKPIDELRKAPIAGDWVVVPRVDDINHGINLVRSAFGTYYFDATGCKEGLVHIENYSKSWNERLGCWSSEPRKDIHTEAADSLRQHAQGFEPDSGLSERRGRRERDWKTA